MNWNEKKTVRIAILDLYEGVPNQGMRGLRDIVQKFGSTNNLSVKLIEFDVRLENKVPDLSYDIYISSGGPGSPLDSEGSVWEKAYFNWLHEVEEWNADESHVQKKICFFYLSFFPVGLPLLETSDRMRQEINILRRFSHTSFGRRRCRARV